MCSRQNMPGCNQDACAPLRIYIVLGRFASTRCVETSSNQNAGYPSQVVLPYDGAIYNAVSLSVGEFVQIVLCQIDIWAFAQSGTFWVASDQSDDANQNDRNRSQQQHHWFELPRTSFLIRFQLLKRLQEPSVLKSLFEFRYFLLKIFQFTNGKFTLQLLQYNMLGRCVQPRI